jgi:hypothetical protein
MRPDLIVIASIGLQDVEQMSLTQDDKMIHTLAPDRSDQPFGKAILPRRGRREEARKSAQALAVGVYRTGKNDPVERSAAF